MYLFTTKQQVLKFHRKQKAPLRGKNFAPPNPDCSVLNHLEIRLGIVYKSNSVFKPGK